MSWSNSMSEIGPMSVTSPMRCRMISWPAANGIAASSAVPMQTEAPAGTRRAMASDIDVSFETLMESRILPGLMFHYAIRRLLWLVPTILAMALVTFTIMHATPGSPLDPIAEVANPLSPEAQKNLAEHYGLDKPLYHQFGIFVWKAVRGDFGKSFVYKTRSEEHTSELQSRGHLVCRLLLEKKNPAVVGAFPRHRVPGQRPDPGVA